MLCDGISRHPKLLIARPNITGEEIKQHIIAHDSTLSLRDPNYYKEKGVPVPDWVMDDVRSRKAVGLYGPIVCFLGTLTNGFASLLNGSAGFGH